LSCERFKNTNTRFVVSLTVGFFARYSLIVGLVFVFLFFITTFLVFSRITQSWDAQVALIVNNTNTGSFLNSLLVYASEYGREYFWIPVVLLMFVFGKSETRVFAIELAALFVAGIMVGEVTKILFFRERPYEVIAGIVPRVLPLETNSSYPSGHAIIVAIGAISSLVKFSRKSLAPGLAIEAALVCYSRVYVGMHYPLDVVGGIFLGGFIVFVGLFVVEKYLFRLVELFAELGQKLFGRGLFSV
jgi:membrane-associated phospholipid phosphatase